VLTLTKVDNPESEEVADNDRLDVEFNPEEVLLIGGSPVQVTKVDGNDEYVRAVVLDDMVEDAELVNTPGKWLAYSAII
jgi:hypothetical protein